MKSHPVALVVDTDEAFEYMRPMLQRMLDEPQLVHCRTHSQAMDYVESDEYADYIFADWDLSGYHFIDAVRRDLENHNTPMIIMSEDTNNKQVMLNTITRPGTFFLAKPFLEKGLVNKFHKALEVVERRRKNRIHPERGIILKVTVKDLPTLELQLMDISIDGCLFRMPLQTGRRLQVYQKAVVALAIDEFNIEASGMVCRIGQDEPVPEGHDSVLVMIRFTSGDQERELTDLVDELAKRW